MNKRPEHDAKRLTCHIQNKQEGNKMFQEILRTYFREHHVQVRDELIEPLNTALVASQPEPAALQREVERLQSRMNAMQAQIDESIRRREGWKNSVRNAVIAWHEEQEIPSVYSINELFSELGLDALNCRWNVAVFINDDEHNTATVWAPDEDRAEEIARENISIDYGRLTVPVSYSDDAGSMSEEGIDWRRNSTEHEDDSYDYEDSLEITINVEEA
jgi:uncharacterized coiled-coil protein SlyX